MAELRYGGGCVDTTPDNGDITLTWRGKGSCLGQLKNFSSLNFTQTKLG